MHDSPANVMTEMERWLDTALTTWHQLPSDVQDQVWNEVGGPVTDGLEEGVKRLAQATGLRPEEAAMLVVDTVLDRLA